MTKYIRIAKSSQIIENNQAEVTISESTSSSFLATDYESDDSYAQIFSQSIKLVQARALNFEHKQLFRKVRKSNVQHFHKFRVILLSNRVKSSKYIFLIDNCRELNRVLYENEDNTNRNEICFFSE